MAGEEGTAAPREDGVRTGCVGCLTVVAGVGSGGMVGVLVSKAVQVVTNGPQCAGIPTCDWNVYAGWGMLVGVLTLPILTFLRLRQHGSGTGSSERG